MLKTIRAAAVAVIAAQAGGTVAVRAADMSLPPLYQQEPSPMVELGGGWYLRGDAAYSNLSAPVPGYGSTVSNASIYNLPMANYVSSANPQGILGDTLQRAGAFGATLGVGYTFNNWFRMDATFDWRQPSSGVSKVNYGPSFSYDPITQLNDIYAGGGCTGPSDVPTTCYKSDHTQIQSWTGLLNAYGDLGNWGGVTPYVGAGVGLTSLRVSSTENWFFSNGVAYGNGGVNNYCPTGATPCYYNGYPGNAAPTQLRVNFSFALMAGVSYDLLPHVKLDLGYRYLNMGTVSATNATGQVVHPTIDTQEVRLGLRFTPDL